MIIRQLLSAAKFALDAVHNIPSEWTYAYRQILFPDDRLPPRPARLARRRWSGAWSGIAILFTEFTRGRGLNPAAFLFLALPN